MEIIKMNLGELLEDDKYGPNVYVMFILQVI